MVLGVGSLQSLLCIFLFLPSLNNFDLRTARAQAQSLKLPLTAGHRVSEEMPYEGDLIVLGGGRSKVDAGGEIEGFNRVLVKRRSNIGKKIKCIWVERSEQQRSGGLEDAGGAREGCTAYNFAIWIVGCELLLARVCSSQIHKGGAGVSRNALSEIRRCLTKQELQSCSTFKILGRIEVES